MAILEVTRLRVEPARERALLEARADMVRVFAQRPGFVHAELVHLTDGEWLDLIEWDSSADFAESRRRGADSPEVVHFFEQIAEVISSEEGALVRPGTGD